MIRALARPLVAVNAAATTALRAPARAASGSAANRNVRFSITQVGSVMDPYVPPASMPTPLSKDGRAAWWSKFLNLAKSTMYVVQLRKDLPSFVANKFPLEAEQLYINMNKAFAIGRPTDVLPFVTDQMLSTLKGQMRKRPGTLEWEYLGAVDRPSTVAVRYAKQKGDPFGAAQVTVKIHSRQRLTVKDERGSVLATSESDPTEFIILERFTKSDGKWRIAGKVERT
ncbi:hypothetical protein BC828DRAFT_392569 [Blastocladiella britannica]|nr:hypothetical protein BC828DRAFT_392569 [Blastocladiella britannica]